VTYRLSVSDAIKSATGIPCRRDLVDVSRHTGRAGAHATAPLQTLAPAPLSGGLLPVRIAWSGSDASGIRKYALDQQVDGRTVDPRHGRHDRPTAMTRNVAGRPHRTASASARPTTAGNPAAWVYGTGLKVTRHPADERRDRYRRHVVDPDELDELVGRLGEDLDHGRLDRHVQVHADVPSPGSGSARRYAGKAQVYVDGVLKATIDLYAAAISPSGSSGRSTTRPSLRPGPSGSRCSARPAGRVSTSTASSSGADRDRRTGRSRAGVSREAATSRPGRRRRATPWRTAAARGSRRGAGFRCRCS
jgi:hypothetical protein